MVGRHHSEYERGDPVAGIFRAVLGGGFAGISSG